MDWDFSGDELSRMGLLSVSVTHGDYLDRVCVQGVSGQIVFQAMKDLDHSGQRAAVRMAAEALYDLAGKQLGMTTARTVWADMSTWGWVAGQ